nr:uncharacterized protein LOC111420599 [Onthophagus taurus]
MGRSPTKGSVQQRTSPTSPSSSDDEGREADRTVINVEEEEPEEINPANNKTIKGKKEKKVEDFWEGLEIKTLEKETPGRMRTWSFSSNRSSIRETSLCREGETSKRKRIEGTNEDTDELEEVDNSEEAKVLDKSIQKILTLIQVLKENNEQNTKREIKKAITDLEREANVLQREEVKKWINKKGTGVKSSRVEKIDMSTQTETEEQKQDRERREKIRKAENYDDWRMIANDRWKEEDYRRTCIVEGNPVWQQNTLTKVVLVEKDDPEMTKSIQQQYRKAFPALSEMHEKMEEMEIVTRSRMRNREITKRERIFKINCDETEKEIWRSLEGLKSEVKTEQRVALHHLRCMPLNKLRKMIEIIFKDTPVEIDIYTTAAKIEEERKSEKEVNRKKTYALIVENAGKSKKYKDTNER